MRCKHGIEITYCGLCNGTIQKRMDSFIAYKRSRHNNKGLIKKKKEWQRISKENASRGNDLIEGWEIKIFMENTIEKRDYEGLFELAMELNRTFVAMGWWWKLTYTPQLFNPKDHHAHAIIRRFKLARVKYQGVKNEITEG